MAETLRLRLGGVRAGPLSLELRIESRGSCLSFVRRSRTSSSVAVSSPARSESSSTLRRDGDRGLFSLEGRGLGILTRAARQGRNASPRTCTPVTAWDTCHTHHTCLIQFKRKGSLSVWSEVRKVAAHQVEFLTLKRDDHPDKTKTQNWALNWVEEVCAQVLIESSDGRDQQDDSGNLGDYPGGGLLQHSRHPGRHERSGLDVTQP